MYFYPFPLSVIQCLAEGSAASVLVTLPGGAEKGQKGYIMVVIVVVIGAVENVENGKKLDAV